MIIRKKEHWFIMLFIWRGSVLPRLLPRLILLLLVSMAVVYYHDTITRWNLRLNPAPFTLFGIALALFLGFRNNASYERFWEGRKLWGALLNSSRSLARQAHTLIDQPNNAHAHAGQPDNPHAHAGQPNNAHAHVGQPGQATPFVNYLIAMAYALKHQLRGTDAAPDLERLLPADLAARVKVARWKPVFLLKVMGYWVRSMRQSGHIDSIREQSFDQQLSQLSESIGGCERIAGTPLPYSYSVLLHRTVYIYCFLLPLGLVESLGWMTPPIVVFIAYTYTALEAIADELEDPFGLAPNDLALDTMCRTIENSLLELDDRPLKPEPDTKDSYYLT